MEDPNLDPLISQTQDNGLPAQEKPSFPPSSFQFLMGLALGFFLLLLWLLPLSTPTFSTRRGNLLVMVGCIVPVGYGIAVTGLIADKKIRWFGIGFAGGFLLYLLVDAIAWAYYLFAQI